MANTSWMERLKQRWKLGSISQVVVVLIVFACTGFTVLFIKKPILRFLAGENGDTAFASVLYYIFILPLYNVILLGYPFRSVHFFLGIRKALRWQDYFCFSKDEKVVVYETYFIAGSGYFNSHGMLISKVYL